jgi:hypothetical protein
MCTGLFQSWVVLTSVEMGSGFGPYPCILIPGHTVPPVSVEPSVGEVGEFC